MRRLIFVAARDIVVEPKPKRPASTGPKVPRKSTGEPRQKRKRRPVIRTVRPAQPLSSPLQEDAAGPSPASPSLITIRGFPCSSGLRPQPRHLLSRRRVDDGTVDASASDPASPRHHGCTARHPAPGHAPRALAGAAHRRAPSGTLEPTAHRPAAGIPPAGDPRGRRDPERMPLARPQCRSRRSTTRRKRCGPGHSVRIQTTFPLPSRERATRAEGRGG